MDALKQLKLAKNGYIIMSVLFMVLGACLIIWPDCSMAVFCTAVGIMLIVYGLIKILGYFSRDIYCLAFQFDLAFGGLMAAVGVIIIVRRNLVVNLIFGIFGVLILADALFKIQVIPSKTDAFTNSHSCSKKDRYNRYPSLIFPMGF